MNSTELKPGDIIFWVYTHHLNGRSSFLAEKTGAFIRKVKSHTGNGLVNPKAVVRFEGNTGNTTVPYKELTTKARSIKI